VDGGGHVPAGFWAGVPVKPPFQKPSGQMQAVSPQCVRQMRVACHQESEPALSTGTAQPFAQLVSLGLIQFVMSKDKSVTTRQGADLQQGVAAPPCISHGNSGGRKPAKHFYSTCFSILIMMTDPTIADRLTIVRATIRAADRGLGEATLVAVSKTVSAIQIRPALEAGQRTFGENRVQEALEKWPGLRADFDGVELHLIGPLQTNKVADAVALFDVIETLDREKLAHALVRERDKAGGGAKLPRLFIQVNTGAEAQKAGVLPQQADAFIQLCRDELALPLEGLMCIPPVDEEPALHFALLEQIARRNCLKSVSMGMSADFETALEFGASHVRVGSAIFGARERRL